MRNLPLGIAFLAACGNDGTHRLADAAIDGAPPTADAPPDANPIGTVSIEIISNGAPARDVEVYFQDADSTLVATVPTDANGIASATMHGGGYVTAVDPFGANGEDVLDTFAAVRIGDHLRLVQAAPEVAVNFTVDAPVDPAAVHTLLFTTCGSADITNQSGSGTGAVAVTLFGCPSTVDMLVESTDANFLPLNQVFQPAVSVFDGAQVTLTNTNYQPATATSFDLTNLPAASTGANVRLSLASARGSLFQTSTGVALAAGAGSASAPVPAFANAAAVSEMDFSEPFDNRGLVSWGPYSATIPFDGTKLLAPFTALPTFDVPSDSITVALDTGTAPDLEVAQYFNNRNGARFWLWRMATPHAAALAFPHVPTDVFDFNPQASDAIAVDQLLAIRVPGGYDAVRENILSAQSPEDLATATPGSAAFENEPNRGIAARRSPGARDTMWRLGARPGRVWAR